MHFVVCKCFQIFSHMHFVVCKCFQLGPGLKLFFVERLTVSFSTKNDFRIAEEFESHSDTALQDPDFYLGNPVNAYLFVKHFTLDWDRDIAVALTNNSREGKLKLQVLSLKGGYLDFLHLTELKNMYITEMKTRIQIINT